MPLIPLNASLEEGIFSLNAFILTRLSNSLVIKIWENKYLSLVWWLDWLNKSFKSIIFGKTNIGSFLRTVWWNIGVVVSQFLDWWLQHDNILYLRTVIDYVRLMNQCMSIDKEEILFHLKFLWKCRRLFVLGAEFKTTGNIVSQMNFFESPSHPSSPCFSDLTLPNNRAFPLLKALHIVNRYYLIWNQLNQWKILSS